MDKIVQFVAVIQIEQQGGDFAKLRRHSQMFDEKQKQ